MDATFFIILIGLAVSVLAGINTADSDCNHEDISDVCDLLMSTEASASWFGYDDERVMKISDLAAISLLKEDGAMSDYLGNYLKTLYPWENSYCAKVTYKGHTQSSGNHISDWKHSVIRSYSVEYGGELTVEMYLSA